MGTVFGRKVGLKKKKEKEKEKRLDRERGQAGETARRKKRRKAKNRKLTDRHALGVDRAQVGVLEQVHDEVLRRLLSVVLLCCALEMRRERQREERERRTTTTTSRTKEGREREREREKKKQITSCSASSASAVHRKGSGATPLVISRAWKGKLLHFFVIVRERES